jgi:putative endonuclease
VNSSVRRALGDRGEDAVAEWYRRARYEVLARNWRCPEGELDVVAASADGGVVVFCEVKTRASTRFGTGFEAVTTTKQRRLRRLAARWLAARRQAGRPAYGRVRFDVAAVTVSGSGVLEVDVLENAF